MLSVWFFIPVIEKTSILTQAYLYFLRLLRVLYSDLDIGDVLGKLAESDLLLKPVDEQLLAKTLRGKIPSLFALTSRQSRRVCDEPVPAE